MAERAYDGIVVGAGFYGLSLALHLSANGRRILVLEADREPMSRASMVNQARVHGGFHYPRNFVTALRSFHNYQRFVDDFRPAIVDDFQMLYAIARHHSKVNAKRFETMFTAMGASIAVATPSQRALFDSDRVEMVFMCRESAVNCASLRDLLLERLAGQPVDLRLGTQTVRIKRGENGTLNVIQSDRTSVSAPFVFNVTYSQLNTLVADSGARPIPLKHELTEVALVEPPTQLAGLAVTVMDGPFFSIMPFPARKLYSLTHVRYTPHAAWHDGAGAENPYTVVERLPRDSYWRHMVCDAQRFMPALANLAWRESLFTIKTVSLNNNRDDGRPILFRPEPELPGLYSILGSKLDNIYDLFELVDSLKG
jgi:glycine/D-amino acid oxidase-like deaminating enzyme